MFARGETPQTSWLDDLNPDQRRAVTHRDGPLLVVAGAGSGKTRTLASRVAWLIEQGTPAERILLLTFTRRAAQEMMRRAGSLIADRSTGRVWGGTFHSIANRLLRRHGTAVAIDPGFTVLDQGDTEAMMGMVRTELGFGDGKVRFPRAETVAAIYSRTVNEQEKLDKVVRERFPWCAEHGEGLKQIFATYRSRKLDQQVLDYDDLLLYWWALLDTAAGATVAAGFDHVLVDEYQDTNHLQAAILTRLCGVGGNITVVGDDAQAIYSFRAASIVNISRFPADFPGTAVVTLEENYRSTPQTLAAANAVITASAELYPKRLRSSRPAGPLPRLVTCFDEAAQADFVCDTVLAHREEGIALHDQAVLFRTGHHSDGLELELARRHIPFVKYGGLKFLEAAHVKDLLALLRILDNPRDGLAWHRVCDAIPGVGPATAVRLMNTATATATSDGTDLLTGFCRMPLDVPVQARAAVNELRHALTEARGTAEWEPGPAVQIDRLLPFLAMVADTRYDDAAVRLGDLEHLAGLAAGYTNRSRFLTELTLDPPVSTSDLAGPPHLDDDYLVLSTIHSAKGGEWDAVFVIHAADGNIPSDMALGDPGGVEEERRLLYVAMTRARDHLHVSFPQRFYHRRFGGDDRHSYAPLSRFLQPVTEHFETMVAGLDSVPEPDAAAATSSGTDTVGALLASLFE
ncbi:MAG: ATP-dependent helicase [Acidimicrobiia bacterium]|nr:ATP-dependent helicase [Acidimicrobiia bacterium]